MKNAVHMLRSEGGSQMNSFVIETDQGGIILIDGGYTRDAADLLEYVKALTGRSVPHIDAWILSHVHSDHVEAFIELWTNHRDEFTCDKVYYNFPSVQFVQRHEAHEAHTNEEFTRALPYFAAHVCTVTAGDSYEVAGARFDILYTPDPAFTMNAINNSSIVFRLTLNEKTFMFLGDLGVEAGNKLLDLHGEKLRSDYVQMAHHGQNGVTLDVYKAISPKACFWCTPLWLWNNDAGLGYNTHTFRTIEVREWMESLGVKTHYVMKDGNITVEI